MKFSEFFPKLKHPKQLNLSQDATIPKVVDNDRQWETARDQVHNKQFDWLLLACDWNRRSTLPFRRVPGYYRTDFTSPFSKCWCQFRNSCLGFHRLQYFLHYCGYLHWIRLFKSQKYATKSGHHCNLVDDLRRSFLLCAPEWYVSVYFQTCFFQTVRN